MRIGVLPLGRATFDLDLADRVLTQMLARLDETGHTVVGPRSLLLDEPSTREALAALGDDSIDHLMVLQATFTDTTMTVAAADAFGGPLSIWAVPEPRTGGRLRLNAFCGLNLASHALGLRARRFSWLYGDPRNDVADDLAQLLAGNRRAGRTRATPVDEIPSPEAHRVAAALRGSRIARIGAHPAGFDTCSYSADRLAALAGVSVVEVELDRLFRAARTTPAADVAEVRASAAEDLTGLDEVDQDQLERSLRLKSGLDRLRAEADVDAFAIRCWPETFTEFGGAVCGPVAMMVESAVPCACEADVYGALTQLVLQEVSRAPVFLTDLVDVDRDDDTAVVWHCGQAPISMCHPDATPTATIHTNRGMALLYQFPLKPGPVTLLRISQSFNEPKMVLSLAEMQDRPMAFTGTSGVLRFSRPASDVLDDIIDTGLEHHMAITYGDHRTVLRSVAAAMQLPLIEL